jgi:hypothetical protein
VCVISTCNQTLWKILQKRCQSQCQCLPRKNIWIVQYNPSVISHEVMNFIGTTIIRSCIHWITIVIHDCFHMKLLGYPFVHLLSLMQGVSGFVVPHGPCTIQHFTMLNSTGSWSGSGQVVQIIESMLAAVVGQKQGRSDKRRCI